MLALRLFKYLGVPEVLVFWATGSLMEAIERMMALVPSFIIMGKIIPPGVEGTMISLTATIININQFLLRQAIGSFINDIFVHVTTENLGNYYILMIIMLIGKFYPLIFLFQLVPKYDEV